MTTSKLHPPIFFRCIARLLSGLLFVCLLANLTPLSAQGWDFYFGGDNEDYGHAIVQTSDLGYLLVGYSESFRVGQDQDFDVYVIKTDVDGRLLWERTYDPGLYEFGRSLQETEDGGFLIAGEASFETITGPFEGLLIKIDRNGEQIWQQTYTIDGVNSVRINDLVAAADGGYLLIGYAEYEDAEDDMLLIKVDEEGEEQWHQIIGSDLGEQGNAGTALDDGFIIVGNADNPIPPPTAFGTDVIISRIDAQGNAIWTETVSEAINEVGADVIIDNDNNIIAVGDKGNDISLWKFNLDGELLDEHQQDFFGLGDEANAIILGKDGSYIIAGRTEVSASNTDQLIASFSTDFSLNWFNTNGDDGGNTDEALGVAPRAKGGYATVGSSGTDFNFINDVVLTTTNPRGGIFTNYIRGTVFHDLDDACDLDPGERRLEGWLVRAQGQDKAYYGTTDADGRYEILVDTGSFVVQPLPINKNWESCQPNGINITFSETYDFINLNGPMIASVLDCPSMEVDVSTPFLSPCSDIAYTVRYANEGSGIAEDASVEIVFDETLEFIDASLPFTLDGEVYRFELGNVDYNTKGSFTIQARVACDGIVEGQTAIVSAQILPDSSCFSPDPGWSGASVSVNGTCDGDESVEFQISNAGSDMPSPGNFFVVEEDLVVFMTNTFDLEENQDTTITFGNPEGKTYRIIAEQVEGHPGNSMPTKAVEGCGQNNDGIFSTGFVTQWAEDDADPAISLHVDEIFSEQPAVFLQGHPEGWRDSIITAETELTYRIFFRNTGLDSTTTIVIRDTLPEDLLDITTFEPGASSHPAQIEVFNTGVLRVTFEDITLPVGTDGSTNTDDYGFFEFRIKQQPGNPSGTVIENEALVYIENNPPLATNTERHVIEGATATDLLEVIPVDVDEPEGLPTVSVDAFPNPATDFVTLQVNGLQGSYDVAFSLMNMQGQVLRYSEVDDYQYTFQREQLPAGSYIYTVRVNGQTAAAGTLIIR